MKQTKTISILLFVLLLFLGINANAQSLGFKKGNVLSSGEITDGVSYENFQATTSTDAGTSGSQNISYVKKTINSPTNIVVWSKIHGSNIVGGNIIDLAKDYETKNPGYKVVAGINGDYFAPNYTPINAMVQNGDLVKYDNFNQERYFSIGFNDSGTDYVASKENTLENYYSLSVYDDSNTRVIKEVRLTGFNQIPSLGETSVIYKNLSEFNDPTSSYYEIADLDYSTNIGTYLLKGQVSSKESNATSENSVATIVTKDSELISLLDKMPYIRVQRNLTGVNDGINNIIGVGSQTLGDGNVLTFEEIIDQSDAFEKARHPRSTIGFSSDGNLIIATIDGRQTNMAGVNLREEALVMKHLGAEDAFNLDGGGSTQILIRENDEFRILNSPSELLRKISNAIFIVEADVSINLGISNLKPSGLDLIYDYTLKDGVDLDSLKLYVNDRLINTESGNVQIDKLNRYGINYLSFVATYNIGAKTYTRTFKNKRINIENSVEVVTEGPSNFKLDIIVDYENNLLEITLGFYDPDSTFISGYLLYDEVQTLFEWEEDKYVARIDGIIETKKFNFSLEYLYNTGTLHPDVARTDVIGEFDYVVEESDLPPFSGEVLVIVALVFIGGALITTAYIMIGRRVRKK